MKRLWQFNQRADTDKDKDQWIKKILQQHNSYKVLPAIIFLALLLLSWWWLNSNIDMPSPQLAIGVLLIGVFMSINFILQREQAVLLYTVTSLLHAVLSVVEHISIGCLILLLTISWTSMIISQMMTHHLVCDAEQQYEIMHQLQNEAVTDWLTGMLNRHGFEKKSDAAWAFCKRHQKRIGYIMVDIDHFKEYNDSWGHIDGDKILARVAACIKECFKRETDIAARVGGEEFLICITDIDEKHIVEMAQLLLSRIVQLEIKAPATLDIPRLLTVSIGISSCIPQACNSKQDLYDQADSEMYCPSQAKL